MTFKPFNNKEMLYIAISHQGQENVQYFCLIMRYEKQCFTFQKTTAQPENYTNIILKAVIITFGVRMIGCSKINVHLLFAFSMPRTHAQIVTKRQRLVQNHNIILFSVSMYRLT